MHIYKKNVSLDVCFSQRTGLVETKIAEVQVGCYTQETLTILRKRMEHKSCTEVESRLGGNSANFKS